MQTRNFPPGLMSMSQNVVVKPCGPHQRATCSGSIHALNTRRRGASMTRVTTSCRSVASAAAVSVATSMAAPTLFPLPLQILQIGLETIEALLPEGAIMLQPIRGVLEWTRLEPTWSPLRLAATRDQPGAFQHFQVLGNAGKAHGERLGQFGDRGLAGRKSRQDRAPRGIGEGGEGAIEAI